MPQPESDLIIPVKGVYFEQIRDRTKFEEYRVVNEYWARRLEGREYRHVVMTLGYPRAGDASKRLTLRWRGFRRKTIIHPHFGPNPVEVYAIDVSERV